MCSVTITTLVYSITCLFWVWHIFFFKSWSNGLNTVTVADYHYDINKGIGHEKLKKNKKMLLIIIVIRKLVMWNWKYVDHVRKSTDVQCATAATVITVTGEVMMIWLLRLYYRTKLWLGVLMLLPSTTSASESNGKAGCSADWKAGTVTLGKGY